MFNQATKVDFKPLTYIEVENNTPLNIKLDDTHFFKCHLQVANDYISFNSNKNIIIEQFTKLNELDSNEDIVQAAKVENLKALIYLLYKISIPEQEEKEKEKKYIKRCGLWLEYLNKLFMKDIVLLYSVFDKVLEYNSSLKKKAQNLLDFEIFTNNASEMTAGGVPLKDLIVVDPITGEKSFKH